VKTLYCHQIS